MHEADLSSSFLNRTVFSPSVSLELSRLCASQTDLYARYSLHNSRLPVSIVLISPCDSDVTHEDERDMAYRSDICRPASLSEKLLNFGYGHYACLAMISGDKGVSLATSISEALG